MMLRYRRRLRMVSEALMLRVIGGQDSHSWWMCVVAHSYGGLGVGHECRWWMVCMS